MQEVEDILENEELWDSDDEEFAMNDADAEMDEEAAEGVSNSSSEDEDDDAEMVIEQPFGYGDEQVGALLDLSNTEEAPRTNSYKFIFDFLIFCRC